MTQHQDTFAFEPSLQQLNDIVEKLDTGDLTVEQSLQLYEQGMTLVNTCQQYLNQSKARVELVHKKQGKINTREQDSDSHD